MSAPKLYPLGLNAPGSRPLLNYWLFTNGAATPVANAAATQLAVTTSLISIPANGLARVINAYASISPSDASQLLLIDSVSMLLVLYDNTGTAAGSAPLPVSGPGIPAKMPAQIGIPLRYVVHNAPGNIEVIPQYEILATGRTAAQCALQAIVAVHNPDTSSHTVTMSVGGIIGVLT